MEAIGHPGGHPLSISHLAFETIAGLGLIRRLHCLAYGPVSGSPELALDVSATRLALLHRFWNQAQALMLIL